MRSAELIFVERASLLLRYKHLLSDSAAKKPPATFSRPILSAVSPYSIISIEIQTEEVYEMATSSIFADFSIRDPETAKNFIQALRESETDGEWQPQGDSVHIVTDPDAIRAIWAKRGAH